MIVNPWFETRGTDGKRSYTCVTWEAGFALNLVADRKEIVDLRTYPRDARFKPSELRSGAP